MQGHRSFPDRVYIKPEAKSSGGEAKGVAGQVLEWPWLAAQQVWKFCTHIEQNWRARAGGSSSEHS